MAVKFLGGILPLEAMMRMIERAKEELRSTVQALSRRVSPRKRGQPLPGRPAGPFRGQENALRARRQQQFFEAVPTSTPVRKQNLDFGDPAAELQLLRSA